MKNIILYENLGTYAFVEPEEDEGELVIGESDFPEIGESEQSEVGESESPVTGESEPPTVGESEAPIVIVLGDSSPTVGTSDNPAYVLGASGYTVEVSNFPQEKPVSERQINSFTPTEFFLFCILLWMVARDLVKLFTRKWGLSEWKI